MALRFGVTSLGLLPAPQRAGPGRAGGGGGRGGAASPGPLRGIAFPWRQRPLNRRRALLPAAGREGWRDRSGPVIPSPPPSGGLREEPGGET